MTGNSICLDTNVAITVLNGSSQVMDWLRGFSELFLAAPMVAELYFGAMNSGKKAANVQLVQNFVSRMTTLDVTRETAVAYAQLRFDLKATGKPIPQNDMWIAAVCMERKLPLATVDAHFDAVPGLVKLRP